MKGGVEMGWEYKKKYAKPFLIGLFAMVLVSLTACGTGNTESGGKGAQGTSSGTPKENVRVGYLLVMDDAPAILAHEADLYQKHGLDEEMQLFTSGTDMIKAIVGGQIDVGVLGFTNALTWLDKGADLKIVGGAQMGYHSLIVRRDSGIKSVRDLKGRVVASQQKGSTADIVWNGVVLKEAGLAPEDVPMQYVSPSVAVQSLTAGRVDAAFVFEPYDHLARATAGAQSIYEVGKSWPFPCMVVIASGETLKKNRELVNRTLDAQKEAIEMLENSPEEAAKYLTPAFMKEEKLQTVEGGSVPAVQVIREAIEAQDFNWEITEDQIKKMQEIVGMMVEQGILKKEIDVRNALDLSWQTKASSK